MFERLPTDLPEVFILVPRVIRDARGFFVETYRAEEFRKHGIAAEFVQENHSLSVKNTIRGLHYQLRPPQAKLGRVTRGEVLDVAVDIRRGSPNFGKSAVALLTAENMHQIFIPPGFAHGFAVLSQEAEFLYKCSDYYDPGGEYGILWSDPALGIEWGIADPVLSEKDSRCPPLAEISEELLPRYGAK